MLSLLALLLPVAWGCDRLGGSSGSGAAAPAGSSAEAEKTKRMEEKKADIERKSEEVRNMQGTDQEKLDAMNSLDAERRAFNDQADKP
jgi:hypothetical protein